MRYTKVYEKAMTKIFFPMRKPDPSIDFFMAFKAIDYADRSLSSAQPRYITVWYRLICIVLHFISRPPPLHSFFSATQYAFLGCIPRSEWWVCYQETNHRHSKNFCWVFAQFLLHSCAGELNKRNLNIATYSLEQIINI